MLAASASGLGPHISPASAQREIARAAKARGVTRPESVEFTARFAEGRDPEFVGQPWADVLLLNVALDERRPANR
jgi:K+-transporting ATPase ATPase C chain